MEREITAIKAQRKNQQRVSIYLDGDFAFGLSRIVAAWLKPGQYLTQAEIEKLQDQDTFEVAFQKAIQFIHHRPRSIEETRRRLFEKGFSSEVIESTIEKLIEKNWLDDLEFARQWIENRNTFRPRSHQFLTYELRQKGVADEIIIQALDQYGADENEMAYRAGIKKAQQCHDQPQPIFNKKVSSFLSRRGFSYALVKQAVDRLWSDHSSAGQEHLN